jgi:hypothetical protein
MPTYTYLCEPLDVEFEEFHSNAIVLETCPECEKANLPQHKPKRLICGTTRGVVQLEGQDLVDKMKEDVKQMKKEMHKDQYKYANLVGESHYQSLQQRIDKQKRK